jgi:hypothetical protein
MIDAINLEIEGNDILPMHFTQPGLKSIQYLAGQFHILIVKKTSASVQGLFIFSARS